jgi:hypothetical protein
VSALRRLLFGETWLLPLGVATVLLAGALLRALDGAAWRSAGGPLLLAAILALLAVSVGRGARPGR